VSVRMRLVFCLKVAFDEVTLCSYNATMKFTWDEAKRQANIEKHGIDFADAPPMFDDDIFTIEDDRFDYGETRYITFGLLQYRVIVVAHTEEDDVIRIISARKATKNEEKRYFNEIGH
jgi:uncharacterized DUF497 family protein